MFHKWLKLSICEILLNFQRSNQNSKAEHIKHPRENLPPKTRATETRRGQEPRQANRSQAQRNSAKETKTQNHLDSETEQQRNGEHVPSAIQKQEGTHARIAPISRNGAMIPAPKPYRPGRDGMTKSKLSSLDQKKSTTKHQGARAMTARVEPEAFIL